MLNCLRCKKSKPVADFYKYNQGKTGYRSVCKFCYLKDDKVFKIKRKDKYSLYYKERRQLRKISLLAFIQRMYTGMNERVNSKNRFTSYNGKSICSRKEFIKYAFSNWQLKELYTNWRKNNYEHFLTPTPDRLDNSRGYTLDNIQFLTFIENTKKR